jgi:hypothetical protein
MGEWAGLVTVACLTIGDRASPIRIDREPLD